MFILLEFIFQGFFEWVYSLILDIWNYFSSSLLNVMSLDFAYIKTHIPVMGDIQQIILAIGWALLLGNLVFQALRSMASGLGFEGEDPKLLFARTFVFGFLLLASPQICETVLGMTSKVIALIEIPDAINVQLVDGSVIGVFTASWILVIIFDLITMFMVFSLLLEVAERYMVLAMLTVMAPLAFAMGGSKSTSEIFAGWCRMFGSMCFLMATNIVFFKMLLSVVSTVPSFPDVFLWMVLIVSIVKVAKKADEIITRIGLNPAITGSRSGLPGMIAYTVFKTALSMMTKGAANGIGGALGFTSRAAAGIGKSAGLGKGAGAAAGAVGGAALGGIAGVAGQAAAGPRYGGGRTQTSQTDTRQEQQSNTQQNTSQAQTGGQRQTAAQERTSGGQRTGPGGMFRPDRPSRKTSTQPGISRGSSYVTPPDSQSKPEKKAASSSGFTGFHGPQGGGFTGSAPSRGGGFTGKGVPRGGGTFGGKPSGTTHSTGFGGSFSKESSSTSESSVSSGTAKGGGVGGAGTKPIPRGGGTFGGKPSGTFSKDSQNTEISQSGTAGIGTRSTQRPPSVEPRPGRNAAPSSGPRPVGGTPSGPAPQERTHSPGRSTGNAPAPSPAPQERRGASAPVAPARTGGPPTARPGPAGTAPAAKQASGKPQAAKSRTTRAKPGYRPPPRPKGGSGHG